MNISRKIILSFIVLILLPTSILLFINYQSSKDIIEEEVTNTILHALKQVEINISSRLTNVQEVSDMLFMNTTLQSILSKQTREITTAELIEEIKELDIIVNSVENNKDIYKLRLFMDSRKIHSREMVSFFPLQDIQKLNWYDQIIHMNGRVFFKSTYYHTYNFEKSNHIISFARMLRDPNDYNQMIGILLLDMKEFDLHTILMNVEFPKNEHLYIIDRVGNIVSHVDKNILGQPISDPVETSLILSTEQDIIKMDSKFIIHRTIRANGWKIVAIVPAIDILQSYKSFNIILSFILLTAIILIFLFTVFVFAAFMVEKLNSRIRNMTTVIETLGIDNYDKSTKIDGEISKLENSIHSMLGTVRNLIEESYQAKLHEKEAQLNALQAQINPHFLYNTLDTLNWMAVKQKATDISLLVDSLAKYFRLSLSKGNDIVTIHEEISLIKVYLDIQRARFGDIYTVLFHINDEVYDYLIPKLTLQPIIENALEHGIQKKKNRKGTIEIFANKLDTTIHFLIKDDGVGIQQECLSQILDHSTKDATGIGYGLYNVHQRIRLFSNNDIRCGLKLSSEENAGTIVEVTTMAIKKE